MNSHSEEQMYCQSCGKELYRGPYRGNFPETRIRTQGYIVDERIFCISSKCYQERLREESSSELTKEFVEGLRNTLNEVEVRRAIKEGRLVHFTEPRKRLRLIR